MLAGTPVQGTAIGTSQGTCWGRFGSELNHAFRADVTNLVTGNGSYVLTGLASANDPAHVSIQADTQGASLVVIYGDPTADSDTTVSIYDGAATLVQFTNVISTMRIPTVPTTPTVADLLLLVGDGQSALVDGQLTVNSQQVLPAAPHTAHYPGFDGNYWDDYRLPITGLVKAGDGVLTVRQSFTSDCLVFVAMASTYTVPVESGAGPTCGGTTVTTSTTLTPTTSLPGSTVVTTTTVPGATTTTTLPPGVEDCGNCRDDDGDGRTDLEDSDCCGSAPLTLKKARLKPAKGNAGTTTRLKLTLSDPGETAFDPTRQDVVLQLHRHGGALDYCAHVPASAITGKRGKSFKFRDKTGVVASAAGIDKMVLKRKKNHTIQAALGGRAARFTSPGGGAMAVTLGFTGSDGTRCATVEAVLTAKGKKGALKAP